MSVLVLGSSSPGFTLELWRVLTYQVPFWSNTATVLRGTTILGLACGAVGTFLLMRKRSLVADALSHAALPGVAAGFLLAVGLGMDGRSLLVLLPSAAAFGLLGVLCIHMLTRLSRVREDAAIGVVLSVFFGAGIVLLGVIQSMTTGKPAGLSRFIFGQAATMSAGDSTAIAVAAAMVIALTALLFKELKLVCFDPQFTASLGWPTFALDALLLAMVTTLTVIGLHAVGAILMVALLIIPAAAARFWTQKLTTMMVLAALMGALACHIGTATSAVAANLPTGPAIVVCCGAMFLVSMLMAPRRGLAAAALQRWSLARRIARQHLLRAMYEIGEMAGRPDGHARIDQLLERRAWTAEQLRRALRRAMRREEIAPSNGGFSLTSRGEKAAARIVRTHRIWEHFLTTQADVAPRHVDRAADDIEHVLSDDLIRDLEAELKASGALDEGAFVPRSPHALAGMREGA